MSSFRPEYERLNSLYLVLWSVLGQMLPDGIWQEYASPEFPLLGVYARRLSTLRESAQLGDKLDPATYGPTERREVLFQDLVKHYWEQLELIQVYLADRMKEVEQEDADEKEQQSATSSIRDVQDSLKSYAKLDLDEGAWQERAAVLRDELGKVALEYSDLIYTEEEAWADIGRI
jgi:predicted alpha-1,6-mannanase (GH76 family)